MTNMEWHDEMRRTLAPHLDSLRRELAYRWPSLDPEMALLHWLCMKHNLEPPAVKLRRPPGAALSTGGVAEDLPTPQLTPSGASSGSRRSPMTASVKKCVCGKFFMPDDKYCKKCGADRSQARDPSPPITPRPPPQVDFTKGRYRGAEQLTPLFPKDASPDLLGKAGLAGSAGAGAPATARALDLGEGPADGTLLPTMPLTARGASRDGRQPPLQHPQMVPLPPEGPKPLGLRTLGRLNAQIEHDAKRHVLRCEFMDNNKSSITDMVANMRQELRGQFLGKVPLLSRNILTEQEQFRLVGKLRPWTFEQGHKIIVEGEIGDKLYIIERGTCEVVKVVNGREHVVGQLAKGAFFGEIAALYDIPRTATVRTTSGVTALSLAREDLMQTIGEEQVEEMRIIARTQVFSSIPLLVDLTSDQKVRIAAALRKQRWRCGAIITGENHITSRLYIVEHGHVMMEAKSKELLPSFWPVGEKALIDLGPGGFFCMRGLLYGAPVGFNITASTETVQTLSISIEEILATAPPSERAAMEVTMKESMQGYLLRQVPQLKQMADEFFKLIRKQAEEVTFKKWSVIFAKGQRIDAVYVLEKGTVQEHDGESHAMMELPGELESDPLGNSTPPRVTPGEFFGVDCLTDKNARASYTLVALTDVTLLRLPQGAVWSVLHEERQHIARIPLLSQDVLGKAEQYMLVGKLRPWRFPAGRCIIREGEIGDMLYVIERGVCEALKEIDGKEVVISQLKKGAFFGELAVMYDMPRTATVRAATDVLAVSLSREDIFSTVSADKIVKMKNIARTQVFNQIPLLCSLDTSVKVKVAEKLRPDIFQEGARIQVEGEPTVRFHIIEKGEVCVEKGGAEVCRKHAGASFGELGLVHREPAHFTCTAVGSEVKTLSISLEEILDTAGTGERPALERTVVSCFRRALLKKIPQMKDKSDEYISAVLNHAEPVTYVRGDLIFEEGSPLGAAFVLERGEVLATGTMAQSLGKVQRPGEEPSRHFGAECLMTSSLEEARAGYSLEAATDCAMLRVPKAVAQLMLK